MSLSSQLTSAWSQLESSWGEQVYLLPCGDPGQQTAATCVIIEDGEEGSNEVRGDGKQIDRRNGREFRRSANMEIARSYGVLERETNPWRVIVFASEAEKAAFDAGDTTLGRRYVVKRRLSTDRDVDTFLLINISNTGLIRRAERKG